MPAGDTKLGVMHEVEDFDAFAARFWDHRQVRRRDGCIAESLLRDSANPNLILAVLTFNSAESAKRFIEIPGLEETMRRGGATTSPSFFQTTAPAESSAS